MDHDYTSQAWGLIEDHKREVLQNRMVVPEVGTYKIFSANDIYKKFKPGCAFCKLFAKGTPCAEEWDIFSKCLKNSTDKEDKCNDEYMRIFAPKMFKVNSKSPYYAVRSALIQEIAPDALFDIFLRTKKVEAFLEINEKNL
ncbi:hypothetical protein AKO1_007657 [Acrasis kona]|uniref:Uncharacterized protein n=1 Tax=Acrasis kona TaxID=1008807 RepID=A0AAW2YS50_9EUKA